MRARNSQSDKELRAFLIIDVEEICIFPKQSILSGGILAGVNSALDESKLSYQ